MDAIEVLCVPKLLNVEHHYYLEIIFPRKKHVSKQNNCQNMSEINDP